MPGPRRGGAWVSGGPALRFRWSVSSPGSHLLPLAQVQGNIGARANMQQKTWASHLKPRARPRPSFCAWALIKARGQVSSSRQRALRIYLFPPPLCPCVWVLCRGQRSALGGVFLLSPLTRDPNSLVRPAEQSPHATAGLQGLPLGQQASCLLAHLSNPRLTDFFR